MKLLRKINRVITSGLIIHIIKSVIQTNVSHKYTQYIWMFEVLL